MFIPLRVESTEVKRLRESNNDLPLPDITQIQEGFYAKLLEQCKSSNGTINGSDLQFLLFPFDKDNYDIFISHSHNDKDLALYLYAWLTQRCGMSCFIDEVLWYSSDALLKEIDKQYCRIQGSSTYDYNKRNFSTSHVHAMLSMAMLEGIDRSECCLIIESDRSLTLNEGIECKTLSPWIYQEVQFATHLRHKVPPRLQNRIVRLFCASEGGRLLCETRNDSQALKVDYELELDSFLRITESDLSALRGRGASGLDDIYMRYLQRRPDRHVRFLPK